MKWLIGLLIAATGLLHLLFGLGIGLFGGSNLNWMLVLNGAGYLVLLFLFWTATGSRRNTIRWILLAYTLITLVGYFLINGAGAWQFTFGLIIKGIELLLAILLLLYRGRDEVTVAATTAAPAASRSGAGVTSTAYQSAAGASSVSTAGPIGAAAVADMVSSEVDATVDAPHVGDRAVADIDAGLDSAAADVGAWGEPTTANIDMGMGAGVGTVRLDAAEPDYMVEDVVAEDVVAEGVVVVERGGERAVGLAFEHGLGRFVLLQPIQIFQEEQPGGLFGVVEFGGAAAFFPEGVVDILEGLFKHERRASRGCGARPKAIIYLLSSAAAARRTCWR